MNISTNSYVNYNCQHGGNIHSLVVFPFECAVKNFKIAFIGNKFLNEIRKPTIIPKEEGKISLANRVKHFCLGALLLCPLLNLITVLVLRKLNIPNNKSIPSEQGHAPGRAASILFSSSSNVIKLFDKSTKPFIVRRDSAKSGVFSNSWIGKPLKLTARILGQSENIGNIVSSENIFQAFKALSFQNQVNFFLMLTAPKPSVAANQGGNNYFMNLVLSKGRWNRKVHLPIPNVYQQFINSHFMHFGSIVEGFKETYNVSADPDILSFTKQDAAMLYALRSKAESNTDFKRQLLKTNKQLIIFGDSGDETWGTGKTGKGQRRYGMILMILRAELSNEISPISGPELIEMIEK